MIYDFFAFIVDIMHPRNFYLRTKYFCISLLAELPRLFCELEFLNKTFNVGRAFFYLSVKTWYSISSSKLKRNLVEYKYFLFISEQQILTVVVHSLRLLAIFKKILICFWHVLFKNLKNVTLLCCHGKYVFFF